MHTRNLLSQNFRTFLQDIENTKEKYSINYPISLVAVSKTFSLEKILELHTLGQNNFGENYLNEALTKILEAEQISKTYDPSFKTNPIVWHFLGHVQSNKAKLVARNFSWVHSVDSYKLAEKLHQYRSADLQPLNILIQVNLQDDKNKFGVSPDQTEDLALKLNSLSNLKLRGLMCILREDCRTFEEQQLAFAQLKQIFTQLKTNSPTWFDTLSMGMSSDYQAAIAAGSTMLRIGRNIFGTRA